MRKLWGLGVQASRRGGCDRRRRAAVRRLPKRSAGDRVRDRVAVDAPPRRRRRAADPQRLRPRRPRRGRRHRRARRLRLLRAARRGPGAGCAARSCGAPARDANLPDADGPWPGTGAIVAAVEAATGVTAGSVGKPEPQLFLTALDRLGRGPRAGGRRPPRRRRRGRRTPRGSTPRSCSRGASTRGRRARRPAAARPRRRDPRPTWSSDGEAPHPPQAFLQEGLPAPARPPGRARGGAQRRHRPRQAADGRGPPGRADLEGPAGARGLSITINTDGAMVDAYVVTDRPDEVAACHARAGLGALILNHMVDN